MSPRSNWLAAAAVGALLAGACGSSKAESVPGLPAVTASTAASSSSAAMPEPSTTAASTTTTTLRESPGVAGFGLFAVELGRGIRAGDFTLLQQRLLPTPHVCTAHDANLEGQQQRPPCVEGAARDEVPLIWEDTWYFGADEIRAYLSESLPAWSKTFDPGAVDDLGSGELRVSGYRSDSNGSGPGPVIHALVDGISTVGLVLPGCPLTGCDGQDVFKRYVNRRVGIDMEWRYVDGQWRVDAFNVEAVSAKPGGPDIDRSDYQPVP